MARVQVAHDLYDSAGKAEADHDFAKAADLYAQSILAGFDLPEVAYGAASAYARAGDKAKAFEYLDRMVAEGYTAADPVKSDADFDSLHQDPRWPEILRGLEKNAVNAKEQATQIWDPAPFGTAVERRLTMAEKIAGLSKFWAEVKYNFIFPERLAKIGWDKLYVEYIPKVLATHSTWEYYRVLAELCAHLKDSHTNVYPASEFFASVGLHTRLVDGTLVVLDVWDPELRAVGLEPGMAIVDIDGQPFRQFAATHVSPFVSASTPQDLEVRTFEYFLFIGEPGQPVRLTVESAHGRRLTRTLRRKSFSILDRLRPKVPGFEFRVLPGNIGYVALNSFDDNSVGEQFLAAFDQISKTTGLILDMRNNGGGNSSVGWTILSTLVDRPVPLEYWQTRDYKPTFRAWGRPIVMLSAPGGDLAPDSAHHYGKPVVVLTSPRSFSAAEDFLVAFDQSGRGTLVGEPSGGSTGQPLNFTMPGGGSGRVCTWRGTYPAGKAFLGIGVQPQIMVSPTLKQVRAGTDTVLATAVAQLMRAKNE